MRRPRTTTSKVAGLAKGLRRERGAMNKTEAAYAGHLDLLKQAGNIFDWKFEAISFRIAHPGDEKGTRGAMYTPDFLVFEIDDTISFVDTKPSGFIATDASTVRMKVAADRFPMFRFKQACLGRKGWEYKEF